ncbi:MAG: hypothetical protein M3P24_08030 [Gemmatimonadota bacterium]|nr:hypothetical protein [Gemmatimonadota bacterium]
MKTRLLFLLPLFLAACGAEREDPERREARLAAARAACIGEELLIGAREKLEVMEALAASGGGPYVYAKAYHDFAQLRAGELAYADSALSADTPADSARYAERAARFASSAPTPGTVERNVAEEYARSFQVVATTPAHYCNRPAPEEGEEK